jgi:RNA polymerase sigma-70 factor (ECF subfamily)
MDDPISIEFAQLLTKYQRRLYAFIMSLIPDPNQANDILQETNLALCKSAAKYDPERNFLAWAFKVARFQVLAFLKKQKRSRIVFDDDLLLQLADDAEEESAHFEDMRSALNTCLMKLPSRHRAIVEARYQDGGTIGTVAKAFRRSSGAITQALFRIRSALWNCVEREMRKIEV